MRILILGNMGNGGYSVAKELRKMDTDVDLAVNISEFGMALPEWEDGKFSENVDPYSFKVNKEKVEWNTPDWIRYFDFKNKLPRAKYLIEKIKARIELIKMIREYDIVEVHVPFSIYTQFSGIPYVAFDAGMIRYFPDQNDIRFKLAKRGYSKAKKILFTNPDTLPIFENQKYIDKKKLTFVPFAIDPEKYKPINAQELREKYCKNNELLIFSPARQQWEVKGNDKIISAYARFIKKFPNSKFIMVDWSTDRENSKKLAHSLGLSNKIFWISPVPKNKLIEYYNAADIVIDQVILGGWGSSTPEAMLCEKVTITSWAGKNRQHESNVIKCFGESPPALHAWHEEEIFNQLLILSKDEDIRLELGKKCRDWIIKTHNPRLVAQKHLEVLEKVYNST